MTESRKNYIKERIALLAETAYLEGRRHQREEDYPDVGIGPNKNYENSCSKIHVDDFLEQHTEHWESEWRPIDEYKPEMGEVLIWGTYGIPPKGYMAVAINSGYEWRDSDDADFTYGGITHFRPKPSPPKTE